MTGKSACGNCGSKTGCGCGTPNPYEQSVEVVWHDPTTYDVTKHGPSFLPKLASSQKAEVRAFVKRQAAFYDTQPKLLPTPADTSPLSLVLQFLRALAHLHQTHHWQTHGTAFYADHLLFERLYNESLEFIDQVAERAVGIDGPKVVDPFLQAVGVLHLVSHFCGHVKGDPGPSSLEALATPAQMVERSLQGETTFLLFVAEILDQLAASEQLSPGTSNLLEGTADKHEAFVYLLKQRLGTTQDSYSYERS